jgi:hypothetical protein
MVITLALAFPQQEATLAHQVGLVILLMQMAIQEGSHLLLIQ